MLKVILAYMGVFAIGKIAFMAAHWTSDDDASLADALAAIWNGLSLDVTIALYLLSVPFLVVTVSVFWKRWQWLAWLLKGYFAIMALPVVLAIVADNVLYRYWGIKLDASVLVHMQVNVECLGNDASLRVLGDVRHKLLAAQVNPQDVR